MVSKAAQKKASKDDTPVVKSVGPKVPAAADKAGGAGGPSIDPYTFWLKHFTKAKFKTPAEAENSLFDTVSELGKAKKFDHAEAAIKAFMQPETHQKAAQPWMYEILVTCIESRKGDDPKVKAQNERDAKQTIGFAAHLARRTKNPVDLKRIADMMVLRGFYGQVGDPGFQTSIGELVDLAAKVQPSDPFAPMMSINLASHDKDPRRMGDSAEHLLSLGWPGYDDKIRRDVKEQVKKLADALRVDGKNEEADALMARLAESESRDVFLRLTWKGEADIDMSVAEPLGATAGYHNPRTVFGGSIVKNGYGNHPEEVYVAPRAFAGPYAIAIEKIVDYDAAKPVLEATLEVILHEGTDQELKETHKINLTKPAPIVFKLDKGRRKDVLPFVAPTETQTPVARPKGVLKDSNKVATPAAPRGVPFR